MNIRTKALRFGAGLIFLGVACSAQMTTVSAPEGSLKVAGTTIAAGTVSFSAVDTSGGNSPVVIRAGDSIFDPQAITCPIVNGALSDCSVPDLSTAVALKSGATIGYNITVTDAGTKRSYVLTGVQGVQGALWPINAYTPTQGISIATGISTGPTVPTTCKPPAVFYTQSSPTVSYQCVNNVFVQQTTSGGNPSPAATAAGNTYATQFKGTSGTFAGDNNFTTDGSGNITLNSLMGKFIGTMPQSLQWRTGSSTTNGCQNVFAAGYVHCQAGTASGGTEYSVNPTATNPLFHIRDDYPVGGLDVYYNGVAPGGAYTSRSQWAKHEMYLWDNNTQGGASPIYPNSFVTRPVGRRVDCNFMNRGRNDAGPGSVSQWTVGACNAMYMNKYSQGIGQANYLQLNCLTYGDCAGWYTYLNFWGGINDGSAEGVTGQTIQVAEANSNAYGTMTSAGTGLTRVKLANNYGNGGNGLMLVNTKAAKYTGNTTGTTAIAPGFIKVSVDTTVTPSPWWGDGTISTKFPPPTNVQAPAVDLFTVTTEIGDPTLINVGSHVCLGTASSNEGEEDAVQSVSVTGSGVGSTVTLGLPHKRAQGGGYTSIALGSCDAMDPAALRIGNSSGWMTPVMAIAYPSANQVLVGWWVKGQAQSDIQNSLAGVVSCPITISQTGNTVSATLGNTGSFCYSAYYANNTTDAIAGTTNFNGMVTPLYVGSDSTGGKLLTWTSGTSQTLTAQTGTITAGGSSANFNIYPMARIANVCDTNPATLPTNLAEDYGTPCIDGWFDLEDNSVTWAANDPWQIPRASAQRSDALFLNHNVWTPSYQTRTLDIATGGEGSDGNPSIQITHTGTNVFAGAGGGRRPFSKGGGNFIQMRGPNNGGIYMTAPTFFGTSAIQIDCANFDYTKGVDCTKAPQFYPLSVNGAPGKSFNIQSSPQTGDTSFSVYGGNLSIYASPLQLWNATTSTVSSRTNKIAGMEYFDTTANHFAAYDSAIALHNFAWLDEVCTLTQTANCPLGGVTSFNTRTGPVTLRASDVNGVGAISNSTTGNAATATALATTPTKCPTGQATPGIDASGNATGCFTPASGSSSYSQTFTGVSISIAANSCTDQELAWTTTVAINNPQAVVKPTADVSLGALILNAVEEGDGTAVTSGSIRVHWCNLSASAATTPSSLTAKIF